MDKRRADFDSAPASQRGDIPTVASWITKEDDHNRKEDALDQNQGRVTLFIAIFTVLLALASAAWRLLR